MTSHFEIEKRRKSANSFAHFFSQFRAFPPEVNDGPPPRTPPPEAPEIAGPPSPQRILVCKYCRSEIPFGARICRYCHARIKYGPTYRSFIKATIASLLVVNAASLSFDVPNDSNIMGDLTLVCFVAAIFIFRRLDRDKITFRRPMLG